MPGSPYAVNLAVFDVNGNTYNKTGVVLAQGDNQIGDEYASWPVYVSEATDKAAVDAYNAAEAKRAADAKKIADDAKKPVPTKPVSVGV